MIYTIMNKTALIVTIGKATEPTIKRIDGLNPDLVYEFLSNFFWLNFHINIHLYPKKIYH